MRGVDCSGKPRIFDHLAKRLHPVSHGGAASLCWLRNELKLVAIAVSLSVAPSGQSRVATLPAAREQYAGLPIG